MNALLSRAVDVTSEGIAGVAPQVGQGNLRALAMQNSKRNKVLPDLPTLAELGVPNAEADTFTGLVAPVGTPADIIKTLNAALNDGIMSADIQQLLANVGWRPSAIHRRSCCPSPSSISGGGGRQAGA